MVRSGKAKLAAAVMLGALFTMGSPALAASAPPPYRVSGHAAGSDQHILATATCFYGGFIVKQTGTLTEDTGRQWTYSVSNCLGQAKRNRQIFNRGTFTLTRVGSPAVTLTGTSVGSSKTSAGLFHNYRYLLRVEGGTGESGGAGGLVKLDLIGDGASQPRPTSGSFTAVIRRCPECSQ